jgi:hypothetical protein
MSPRYWISGGVILAACGVLYAAVGTHAAASGHHMVTRGDVLYASFRGPDGKTSGWTSINNSQAVPGGNGSWNEHRYAELYDNFVVITKPTEKDWGTLVIPTSQLVEIQFSGQGAP